MAPWLQRGSGCTVRSGSGCSGVFVLSTHTLQCAENTKFLVRASYLEIYNEDVRDLLGPDTKQKLEVGAHLARAGGAWGRKECWHQVVLPQKYREGILRAQWLCGLGWGLLNLKLGVF